MKKLIIAATFFLAFALNAQAQKTVAEENQVKYSGIMNEAGTHFNTNNFKEAAEAYTRAMEYNIDGLKTLGLRAQAYYLSHDYKLAVADFDKYIEAGEGSEDLAAAYFMRGASKLALKDENGACADLKRAKELGHEVKEGYYQICEQ